MDYIQLNNQLASFLDNSNCSELSVHNLINICKDYNYTISDQSLDNITFTKGSKIALNYYDNLIIAIKVGNNINKLKYKIIASHNDCPLLKVKVNGIYSQDNKVLANCDFYGGVLGYSWFDRPLKLVGKVVYSKDDKVLSLPFDSKESVGIMPSLAIHYQRNANDNFKIDKANDLKVLCDDRLKDIKQYLGDSLNINSKDILSYDLYFANANKAMLLNNNQFIASSHLDNDQCAYTTLLGLLDSDSDNDINVYISFDGEEIGSNVLSGAFSRHLDNILAKVSHDLGYNDDQYHIALNNSLMLSVDNAHARHYAHADYFDDLSSCDLNKGIVIKYSPRKAYQSESYSSAILKKIMNDNNIPYQEFENKAGVLGGSTLGGHSLKEITLPTVDIGLAQYAMHSCYELAGCLDSYYMYQLAYNFYSKPLQY